MMNGSYDLFNLVKIEGKVDTNILDSKNEEHEGYSDYQFTLKHKNYLIEVFYNVYTGFFEDRNITKGDNLAIEGTIGDMMGDIIIRANNITKLTRRRRNAKI